MAVALLIGSAGSRYLIANQLARPVLDWFGGLGPVNVGSSRCSAHLGHCPAGLAITVMLKSGGPCPTAQLTRAINPRAVPPESRRVAKRAGRRVGKRFAENDVRANVNRAAFENNGIHART